MPKLPPLKDGFAKLPPRLRKSIIAGVVFLVCYTLVGFLILPPIVQSVAVKRLSRELNRPVAIQTIKINPYAFSVTVRGFLVKDRDGEPFLSWDEVYVNFQLVSFVSKPWVFRELRTSHPYVRVQMNKDYTLNFSDLIEKFSKSEPAAAQRKARTPAGLRVDLLKIGGAKASFTDLTPREPFRKLIGPLEITLTSFRTDPKNKNPYSFSGTTEDGEKFSWSGHFYLDPIRSAGEITLGEVTLSKFASLYQDLVRFEIRDGVISLRSNYDFELNPVAKIFAVTNTAFTLTNFKLGERQNPTNLVELPSLSISGISGDSQSMSCEVSSIQADGGRVLVRRNKDATINMLELARPADTATNTPGGILLLLQSVTNVFAQLLATTNLVTGTIQDVSISNCAVRIEDLVNSRPVALDLQDITLRARDASNLPKKQMTAALSLRWDTNGAIRTDVTAGLDPPRADIKLGLENISLRPLDPYLEPYVSIFILGSRLGLDGDIHLRRTNQELPVVTFGGNMRLEDFASVDARMADEFVKWSAVSLNGIAANLNPPEVAINEIAIRDAYARVIIETNRSINLLSALHLDSTNSNAAAAASSPPPVVAAPATNGLPAKVTVGSITISNAEMRFTDRSLQPAVNASIAHLSGSISKISTEELQRATIDLRGSVDKTGPVEITGQLNPLNQKQPTDLKVSLKNVDLHPAGPYSGKFIGYRLNKGKLNMDLAYHVAGGKLKSQNIITVDQLTLGEKVDSPDATTLPVRLAIAILKDRNGRIELDVPIEGSLEDPEFHLGKVIRRAIVNVITKIATSPFAALGALFGGKGEEISFQEFTPGSIELLPESVAKLDTLVKALYERPGLKLEIEGSVDSEKDADALRKQKLEADFRLAKWKSLRKSEQARTAASDIRLTPEEYQEHLKDAYAVAFSPKAVAARAALATNNAAGAPGSGPTVIKTVQPVRSSEPEKGATLLIRESAPSAPKAPPDDMTSQLMTLVEITGDDFRGLAAERAQSVKEYLATKGNIEPERIFLMESGTQGPTSKGARVYLHLR